MEVCLSRDDMKILCSFYREKQIPNLHSSVGIFAETFLSSSTPDRQLTWRNLIFSCFAPPPRTHFSVNSALMVGFAGGKCGVHSQVVGVSRANIFSLLNEEKSFLSKAGMERRENIIEPSRKSHCVGLIDQFL